MCEDVARRSLALPFFPQLTEGEVARVVEAVREVVGQPAGAPLVRGSLRPAGADCR